jgi:hypothetical protein
MKLLLWIAPLTMLAADLTPQERAVIDRISAESMRGHLSFIASDALQGRLTPSPGLDMAAEYIAAQFRRAGLEPAAGTSYFQTAKLLVREQNPEGYQFTITAAGKTTAIDRNFTMILPERAIAFDDAPVTIDKTGMRIGGENGLQLRWAVDHRRIDVIDPENPRPPRNVVGAEVFKMLNNAALNNATEGRATLHVGARIERTATTQNVAGILRGSDPSLRDTYVMLTAHYDHVGTRAIPNKPGDDTIFNGANDDGSGTVSVMEIAAAIAVQNPRPKRSILFMTFFGEELGDVGSRYYARHPLVPLKDTIADLNLEQVGRTDDSEGAQVGTATVTGFDFSDMTKPMVEAGPVTGIKVYKSEAHSDQYFRQSDNLALAEAGVPAHTMGVAFDFPDYHGVGDEWQKVDYANMAKVDRTVAIALLHFASDAPPPKWNAANPKTKTYVEAAEKLRAK